MRQNSSLLQHAAEQGTKVGVKVALYQQNLGALQSSMQAAVDVDSERRLIFWEPPASGKHGVLLSRFS